MYTLCFYTDNIGHSVDDIIKPWAIPKVFKQPIAFFLESNTQVITFAKKL